MSHPPVGEKLRWHRDDEADRSSFESWYAEVGGIKMATCSRMSAPGKPEVWQWWTLYITAGSTAGSCYTLEDAQRAVRRAFGARG